MKAVWKEVMARLKPIAGERVTRRHRTVQRFGGRGVKETRTSRLAAAGQVPQAARRDAALGRFDLATTQDRYQFLPLTMAQILVVGPAILHGGLHLVDE